MKVILALLFAIAAVSAKGSGPYLPSGWRPSGPAFFLPSEVTKAPESPLKQTLQETEASGSDALREYGPPKFESALEVVIKEDTVQETKSSNSRALNLEVSQDITNQALPDVVTEQSFYVEIKNNEEVNAAVEEIKNEQEVTAAVQEGNSAPITAEELATSTESQTEILEANTPTDAEPTTLGKSFNIEQELTSEAIEISTENTVQEEQNLATVAVKESNEANTESATTVIVQTVVETATESVDKTVNEQRSVVATESVVENAAVVAKVAEEVSNIAETIVNLEKEVEAEVKTVQDIAEIKLTQESIGSLEQVPEGFLEYGPPGFKEYGPPKEDLTSAAIVELPQNVVENNEVRRRRYSPKFRLIKKH